MGTMLYNGVELPDIETVWTDKGTYPYAVLLTSGSIRMLYLKASKFTAIDGKVSLSFVGANDTKYVYFSKYDNGEWEPLKFTLASLALSSSPNVFWTNTDILNADGTLYLAASDPVDPNAPTVDPARRLKSLINGLLCGLVTPGRLGRTPVAYSYNGVELPKLPEWDKTAYPYAVIYYFPGFFGVGAYYYSIFSPTPIESDTTDSTKFTISSSAIVHRTLNSSNPWEESTLSGGAYSSLKWANYDIYDAESNLVLAASEPVPIYGVVNLFEGDVTLTKQASGVPANLAYQFTGLDLTETDHKIITIKNTLLIDAQFKGAGNLGNSALYDSTPDLTLGENDATEFYYLYFDEHGVLWLVENNESPEIEEETITVKIVKYIV